MRWRFRLFSSTSCPVGTQQTVTITDDYTIGSKSLTLPAGVGTAASEITTLITAVDDGFFEGVTHEQLTLAGTHSEASFSATRSVTITENEDAPKLTLSFTDDSISENGGSTAVTASVSPRTVDAFTVHAHRAGDGSTFPDATTVTLTITGATGESTDHTILSKSLTRPVPGWRSR